MTLHRKTLVMIAGTVGVLLLVLSAITRTTILRDFHEMETDQARDSLRHCRAVFDQAFEDMELLVTDWACWDDTYRFIHDQNSEYIQSNLVDETFTRTRMVLMAFMDRDGTMVFRKAFDLEGDKEIPLPAGWDAPLTEVPDVLGREGSQRLNAIIQVPGGPLMIAAASIVHSDGSGPSAGTLIMGRLIDANLVQRMQRLLQAPVAVHTANGNSNTAFVLAAWRAIERGESEFIQALGEDVLVALTPVPDIHGKPALLLQTDLTRRVYRQGHAIGRTIKTSIVVVGVGLGGVIMLLLHSQILARMSSLSETARDIAMNHDAERRVPVSGHDELTRLAESINEMLAALSASTESLRENERVFRATFNQTFQYTCLMKPDGTVIDASTSVRDALPGLEDRLVGTALWKSPLWPTSEIRHQIRKATSLAAAGECVRLETVALSPRRGPIPIDLSIKPVKDESGNATLLLTEGHDLTEHKLAQESLREANEHAEAVNRELELAIERANELAQQAESANAAKSNFLASISHELRTPLHGILSFSAFGIKKHATVRPEKLLEYFQMIQQSGDILLELLNDLLDLAKLEAGRMTFTFRPTRIQELIHGVVDEFRSLVAERGIQVEYSVAENVDLATVDPDRIRQVIRNLLANAVKFSPDNARIDASVSRADEWLRVAVRDQGPGVPPDELEMVFEKFIQSSRTKSLAGGTGLGLAICQEIVLAHQGRIWADNNPDGGATFSFEIPLVIANDVAEGQEAHPEPESNVSRGAIAHPST